MKNGRIRIGYGFDIHRLVPNRKLILGGVLIPFDLGEEAYSDGDVLLHAIAEALLGSLALGDLGIHFPENQKNDNISSLIILQEVILKLRKMNYLVVNVDANIHLEKPFLRTYLPEMRKNIAEVLNISIDDISIKPGTMEKVGAIGFSEAVAASAIVLVEKEN